MLSAWLCPDWLELVAAYTSLSWNITPKCGTLFNLLPQAAAQTGKKRLVFAAFWGDGCWVPVLKKNRSLNCCFPADWICWWVQPFSEAPFWKNCHSKRNLLNLLSWKGKLWGSLLKHVLLPSWRSFHDPNLCRGIPFVFAQNRIKLRSFYDPGLHEASLLIHQGFLSFFNKLLHLLSLSSETETSEPRGPAELLCNTAVIFYSNVSFLLPVY